MGSLGPAVSLPDNPKAWSCSNLPATTNRKALTEQHISDLREILQTTDDGSVLLVPGDEGFEESLKRWSRAAEKRAVSVLFIHLAYTYLDHAVFLFLLVRVVGRFFYNLPH